ncbi:MULTISPECIES: tripartite tricarboxylate transporter TctB family protein [unclassified Halomonas]|uniref:tripartite tricarboxylate transporter TctB family protein n=1 Tax=unclassified Halomonas TaxID=2609666 RepID=UPI0020A0468F|nr:MULTISPECIES: tripartite tricarboxylate transporter TctB family protein [unclassified Halomonas]MCP1315512.1 tripartite tricarboxylate transporter TctB family protein [Halomonas sp. 707D7]MCP1328143.1 tripartite tricarboxylate transporter TctB family protein [Halomonas sp. 707D4]
MVLKSGLKRTDCGLALLLLAFCAFAAWRTTLVPSTGAGSQAGPSFLPWIAIVGIALLSLGLFLRGALAPAPASDVVPARGRKITYPTVVLVLFIVLMIGYAVAFERVGYLPSTIATFVIGMLLLRERRVLQFLVVPALIVAGVYLGFTHLLDVYLP